MLFSSAASAAESRFVDVRFLFFVIFFLGGGGIFVAREAVLRLRSLDGVGDGRLEIVFPRGMALDARDASDARHGQHRRNNTESKIDRHSLVFFSSECADGTRPITMKLSRPSCKTDRV